MKLHFILFYNSEKKIKNKNKKIKKNIDVNIYILINKFLYKCQCIL